MGFRWRQTSRGFGVREDWGCLARQSAAASGFEVSVQRDEQCFLLSPNQLDHALRARSDGARYEQHDDAEMSYISQLPPVRFLQPATAGAAAAAGADWHVNQSDQRATLEPAAAPAEIVEPAEDLSLAPADSADCPPLPWALGPEPAAEPTTAPPPVPAPAPSPSPTAPQRPPTDALPPAEETKLLDAAPTSPADDVLWGPRCQGLGHGHPHLLQLRVRRLTVKRESCL